MTVCNMAIEAGARSGMIAVDETTINYVLGRPYAVSGDQQATAVEAWKQLQSDPDAVFDKVIELDGASIEPQVTWGTSPEMVLPVTGNVPDPDQEPNPTKAEGIRKAIKYMGVEAGQSL